MDSPLSNWPSSTDPRRLALAIAYLNRERASASAFQPEGVGKRESGFNRTQDYTQPPRIPTLDALA